MSLVKVPEAREAEMLQRFCDASAFTLEGIDLSDKKQNKEFLKRLEKICRDNGYTEKHFVAYWFGGQVMNRIWGLSGSNAYPDTFRFLVVPDFTSTNVKVMMGARWFSDIVANNIIKQHAVDTGAEPDFDYEYTEQTETD